MRLANIGDGGCLMFELLKTNTENVTRSHGAASSYGSTTKYCDFIKLRS